MSLYNSCRSLDEAGNNVTCHEDHVIWSCDRRRHFHEQIAESFDESSVKWSEEKAIFEYMRNEQSGPETVDEICRQTGVETAYVLHWLETMVFDEVVQRLITTGVTRYALTEKGRASDCNTTCIVRPKFFLSSQSLSCDNDVNGNASYEQWSESKDDSCASAEELEQHLEEGCWVLVTGCDSGEFIAGLAKKFPHTSFIALNKDRESLLGIMETCFKTGAYNVNVQEGDPGTLPNSWIHCFDWVILYDIHDDLMKLKSIFENTRRILKKNGVMSLTLNPSINSKKDAVDIENISEIKETGDNSGNNDSVEHFVKKMLAETLFQIIRSDQLTSGEDRIHVMCVHNNEV